MPYELTRQKFGGSCLTAYKFRRNKQEMLKEARDSLNKVMKQMKYADKGRRPLEFKMGDRLLLKLTLQIWKKMNSKTMHRGLIPKYDGHFAIVKKVRMAAHKLALPDRLKIHPTFHVSFLKPFHKDVRKPSKSRVVR